MKIKKLNESYINELNNLPSERGISKVRYELIKEYQNILKSYPVGKILRHRIDAGEEIFTKIEDGEYGWWEHQVWRGDKQRISEFDMAKWLAGRAVISRSDIIEENLNNMKIKKLNESSKPSKETLNDCLQDYKNNAFGYDGVEDYVDTQYPMHPQEFKSEIINYLKQNIINESKYISEDTSYEWKPNTSFKHIKDIYNKVKENNYKYVNNEREEFMVAVKKADNKGYKPEQCRQIKDWHRDVWQHNKKNESFDVDKVKKRIARHNEFDNGHVLHDWQNMTSQEAEDKAREASIKNPDDIYYVAYDNIMEPASDIKWKNGKQIDESLNELKEHAEIDTLQGPEQGPKVGLASLLNNAIKDEWEAIETYNSLAVTARAEGFEYIANEIDEINTDENTHVGKLQELLKTISPNAEAIELGEDEGKEQLDDINDDMSEDDVLAYTNKYM